MRRALFLLLALAADAAADPLVLSPSGAERRRALEAGPKDAVVEQLRAAQPEALFKLARSVIEGLDVYRVRVVKNERIGKETTGPVEMLVTLREKPYTAVASFVSGLGKGRRALFNPAIRSDALRVREPGFVGLFGPLWVRLDNPVLRWQSNHAPTELGFGHLLDLYENDFRRAEAAGGLTVEHLGFGASGDYCLHVTGPGKAKELYSYDSRFCVDLARGLPTLVEVRDQQGFFESFAYSDVEPVTPTSDLFSVEKAGL